MILACGLGAGVALAQCPARPNTGTEITNPPEISSQNGALNANFTFRSSTDGAGYLHECYIYQASSGPVEAPTLRLNPGDQLNLNLTNRLTYSPPPPPGPKAHHSMAGMAMTMGNRGTSNDPCNGGTVTPTATNIHFQGLNIPPKCHQDEIIQTVIENTDAPFQYSFQVPSNDAPGLYWYHPHVHGEVTVQVNGGASGALIIGGIEKVKPQVAGLPERVFVIRQQFTNPNSWVEGPYQMTVNYQPALYPTFPPGTIRMKPGAREFWRIVNACSTAFLNLQIRFGSTPQALEIIELDGIPVKEKTEVTTIAIPPAGRAEFIMQGPQAGQTATFQHLGYNTGPVGDLDVPQELAVIQTSADAQEPRPLPPVSPAPNVPTRFLGLETATVTAKRRFNFSEAPNGTNGPLEFFITVDGQTPKVFSMSGPPAVTTTVGAVEDWTIANRTGEVHAFHMHQIHFLFLAQNGQLFSTPELRDTVILPAWSGSGPFPTVTLRMDFRDPDIAGRFVYHCHILDHEDAGMMAIIQVNPK
jgi:FtsP/CotA-like multicopper oxidase with cupredoxin domain